MNPRPQTKWLFESGGLSVNIATNIWGSDASNVLNSEFTSFIFSVFCFSADAKLLEETVIPLAKTLSTSDVLFLGLFYGKRVHRAGPYDCVISLLWLFMAPVTILRSVKYIFKKCILLQIHLYPFWCKKLLIIFRNKNVFNVCV